MEEKKFNLLSKFKVYFGISKDINLIFESFVNFFFRNFNLLLYKKNQFTFPKVQSIVRIFKDIKMICESFC